MPDEALHRTAKSREIMLIFYLLCQQRSCSKRSGLRAEPSDQRQFSRAAQAFLASLELLRQYHISGQRILLPNHPPICAYQNTPEMDSASANGGSEANHDEKRYGYVDTKDLT